MFKKSLFVLAVASLGIASTTNSFAANTFSFVGGVANADGVSAPSGSWYSFTLPSTYYTPMLGADGTGIPGPNGTLNFDVVNTLTLALGGGAHNSGNMIDRDAIFLAEWTAHSTAGALGITWDGTANVATVNMSNWRWNFNGQTYDLGAGAPALLDNQDGMWGNGNDTLDYTSSMSGAFTGVQYGLHMVGSANLTPVPEPSAYAMMLAGLGLLGFAARSR